MKQYLDLCERIITEGEPIYNKRTGKVCYTVINADLEYDVGNNIFPLVTTRKSYWKSAIAELLGYLRGYDSAAQFRAIGCNTWNANANENVAWLNNPNRKGEDDLGRIYGAVARKWPKPDGSSIDLLTKVVNNLSAGIDDRGEILTFWNPGEFDAGCLRPCMHTHTFSLVNGTLYLTSTQRSADSPLGLNYNSVQCFVLLLLMARITGHKPGKAFHKIVNAHIYEDQLPQMLEQVKREPFSPPSLFLDPCIKTLDDVENVLTADHFRLEGYLHHPPINYPVSV